NGTVDAAGKGADDALVADLFADRLDGTRAVGRHRPVALDAGDLVHEVGDEFRAVRRVHHFRVEHGGVVALRLVGADGEGGVFRRADDLETFGRFSDAVAVAHPDRIFPANF